METKKEILIGQNLSVGIGTELDVHSRQWTRLQRPRFWVDGRKLGRVLVTRKDGRAPGDVDYYGFEL